MSWAKIAYSPDGISSNTLTFSFPPTQVPAYSRAAVRHDNLSSAGLRETILERIDDLWEVNVPTIPSADVLAWQEFFDFALMGGAFDYYPDASLASFTTYMLDDLDAALAYKAPGLYSAKFKVRKQIT